MEACSEGETCACRVSTPNAITLAFGEGDFVGQIEASPALAQWEMPPCVLPLRS